MVLKRFLGRTNISLMFLFPWLDWGDDISDFEKIDFWPMGDFGVFPAPGKADFYDTCIHRQKIFKKCGMKKLF